MLRPRYNFQGYFLRLFNGMALFNNAEGLRWEEEENQTPLRNSEGINKQKDVNKGGAVYCTKSCHGTNCWPSTATSVHPNSRVDHRGGVQGSEPITASLCSFCGFFIWQSHKHRSSPSLLTLLSWCIQPQPTVKPRSTTWLSMVQSHCHRAATDGQVPSLEHPMQSQCHAGRSLGLWS